MADLTKGERLIGVAGGVMDGDRTNRERFVVADMFEEATRRSFVYRGLPLVVVNMQFFCNMFDLALELGLKLRWKLR